MKQKPLFDLPFVLRKQKANPGTFNPPVGHQPRLFGRETVEELYEQEQIRRKMQRRKKGGKK